MTEVRTGRIEPKKSFITWIGILSILRVLCTYQCKASGGRHGVGIWLSLLALRKGIWPILFSQRRWHLNLPLPDVGMDLTANSDERDWDWIYVSHIHASRTRHAVWKDLETMEANENKVKVSGFYCIDQLDPYRYCGIKVNGSKEKPSRFCKYSWSVWGWHSPQSRYKAYKTDFLCILLLRTIYSNLQNVDFLLKVSVFYAVY